jgi:hypothetical protein
MAADTMRCRSCGSQDLGRFTGELAIHFSGLKNINEPHVWVFPELVVCLKCGFAEFAVPETELRRLAKGRIAGAE